MKYDFLILGADGMQGTIVARYLLERGYKVFCTDIAKTRITQILRNFNKTSSFAFVDVSENDRLIGIIQKSNPDVVINCAEGDWNLGVFQTSLLMQKNCIDLGSSPRMTKEQLKLDKHFKKIKRTAITGCGSVPGIGNVMLAFASKKFDSIESIDVGFAWDSNIKKFVTPFSIESVLEEFTTKASFITGGKLRKIYPKDSEKIKSFSFIGPQKIFLAEHAEVYTFFHYFKPYGVKHIRFYAGFPEHCRQVIRTLTDLTFHNKKPILFRGREIVPDAFLAQLLKRIKIPRNYKEWENLWVEIKGKSNRQKKKILMECIVPPLRGWEEAGCNIDTGFPAAIIAEMIKHGRISKYGSFASEAVVPPKPLFKALKRYKFSFFENGKKIKI